MNQNRRSFVQHSTLLALGLSATVGSASAVAAENTETDGEQEPGTLAGTVTHFGQPIDDATLKIDGGGSTTTDEDGAFSLDVAPGTGTVSVTATGYADETASIEITAGETTTREFALDEVWGPETGELDVIATPIDGGEAIPCEITLFGDESRTVSAPLGAIPDGQHWTEYLTVTEGWWEVRVSDADGYSDGYKRVHVDPGETTMAWVELGETGTEIPDTGHLVGRVVDERGRAIDDATVTIGGEPVTTDAAGTVELDVAHGRHETTTSAPGYEDREGIVLVKFGRTTTLTIALEME